MISCPICNKQLKNNANSLNTHLNTHKEYVDEMIKFSCKMFVRGYKFNEICEMERFYFSGFWASLRVKENPSLVEKYKREFKFEILEYFKNGLNCSEISRANEIKVSKNRIIQYLKDELGDELFKNISKKNKNLKTSNSLKSREIKHNTNKKKNCSTCNVVFHSNKYNNCRECRLRKENDRKFKNKKLLIDYVVCPYCNYKMSLIGNNHLKKHDKTQKDLFCEFGEDIPYYSLNWFNNKIENLSNYNSLNSFHEIIHNGKKYRLRSKWELDCFNLLIDMDISFKYEELAIKYKHPIKGCVAHYLPDFYLPKYNAILEVKPDSFKNDMVVKVKMRASIDSGYDFYFLNEKQINKEYLKTIIDQP